jgi:AraC family transcriptional regulator
LQGGLYAVFTTPWADDDTQLQLLQETWKQILHHWLPESQYEYDATRLDYEYHDERAHSDENEGKSCTDVCIPIRLKK